MDGLGNTCREFSDEMQYISMHSSNAKHTEPAYSVAVEP